MKQNYLKKMIPIFVVFIFTLLSCSYYFDDLEPTEVNKTYVDTSYIYIKDTVLVYDTIYVTKYDTVRVNDTLKIIDTVKVFDHVIVKDTVYVTDTVTVTKIKTIYDTLKIIDTIFVYVTVRTQPQFDWYKGWVGDLYYSSYWTLYEELPGFSEFHFNGQPNVNYPSPQKPISSNKMNGLINIHLPTHSINNLDNKIISKVKMELFDSDNNLVWFLNDQKGGFHPKFYSNKRGNNHPDQSIRWIKPGIYKLKYWNISDDPSKTPQLFTFYNSDGFDLKVQISDGNYHEYQLDMRDYRTPYGYLKINCNME